MKLPHSPGILPPDILSLVNQLLQDSNHCKNLLKQLVQASSCYHHCLGHGTQLLYHLQELPASWLQVVGSTGPTIYKHMDVVPQNSAFPYLLHVCMWCITLLACLLAEWQGHASARCNTKPCMHSTVHVMCVAAGLSNPTASVGFPTQQHHWAFQPKRCCSSMGLPTLTTCTDGIFFD